MVLNASPPPEEPRAAGLRLIQGGKSLTQDVAQTITSAAQSDIVAAGAEASGVVAGAVGGLLELAYYLAIYAILDVIIIILWWLYGMVDNLPILGSRISAPLLWTIRALVQTAIPVNEQVIAISNLVWGATQSILHYMLPTVGGATIAHVHTIVGNSAAPINTALSRLESLAGQLQQAVVAQGGHLETRVHALWTRLSSLEDILQRHSRQLFILTTLAGWSIQQIRQHAKQLHNMALQVKTLLSAVSQLSNRVRHIESELTRVEREVQTLRIEVAEIIEVVNPTTEIAVNLSLLGELVATGPQGLSNLVKLAHDPCFCFSEPGAPGWLNKAKELHEAHEEDP